MSKEKRCESCKYSLNGKPFEKHNKCGLCKRRNTWNGSIMDNWEPSCSTCGDSGECYDYVGYQNATRVKITCPDCNKQKKLKPYRKKSIQMMRPYREGEILDKCVSISQADRENGSPKVGDMIAVNPKDNTDQWLIAKRFFMENYEEVETRHDARKE